MNSYLKELVLWEHQDASVVGASVSMITFVAHHLKTDVQTIKHVCQNWICTVPCMFFLSVGMCIAITLKASVSPELSPTLSIWSRRLSILLASWIPSALASWLMQEKTWGSTVMVRTFLRFMYGVVKIHRNYSITIAYTVYRHTILVHAHRQTNGWQKDTNIRTVHTVHTLMQRECPYYSAGMTLSHSRWGQYEETLYPWLQVPLFQLHAMHWTSPGPTQYDTKNSIVQSCHSRTRYMGTRQVQHLKQINL